MKFDYIEIPAELLAAAKAAREHLVESAAENSDALMDKYLGGEDLSEEEVIEGIRIGTLSTKNYSGVLRFGFQEQRCASDAGWRDSLSASAV